MGVVRVGKEGIAEAVVGERGKKGCNSEGRREGCNCNFVDCGVAEDADGPMVSFSIFSLG